MIFVRMWEKVVRGYETLQIMSKTNCCPNKVNKLGVNSNWEKVIRHHESSQIVNKTNCCQVRKQTSDKNNSINLLMKLNELTNF